MEGKAWLLAGIVLLVAWIVSKKTKTKSKQEEDAVFMDAASLLWIGAFIAFVLFFLIK